MPDTAYVYAKNGMGDYQTGTGMREDMLMQAFNMMAYQGGVQRLGDLVVTETSPASMAVTVAAGNSLIPNSSYVINTVNTTRFWGMLTEEYTVDIDTNTSGSTRVDLIVATILPSATPGDYASGSGTVTVEKGTPGAGTPATPANSIVVATLTIPTATTTSITTSMIADSRLFTGMMLPTGDMAWVPNRDGNVEKYDDANNLLEIFVPLTGDMQAAADAAPVVSLSAGTFNPLVELDISTTGVRLIGAGSRNTIIDASAYTASGQAVVKMSGGADRIYVQDMQLTASSNVNRVIESDTSGGTVSDCVIKDVFITGVNTGIGGIYTDATALSANWIIENVTITGDGNGVGMDLNALRQSEIKKLYLGAMATAWSMDVTSDNNIADIRTKAAGINNSGTGTIREEVYP